MIDTQQYRIRIGRFYGSTRRMCVTCNRNINVTKSTNKNVMILLVLLLCGVGMLFVGNLLFNTVAGWNENADILSGDGMKLRDGMKLKEWSECITTIMMIGMSVGEWMRMLIGKISLCTGMVGRLLWRIKLRRYNRFCVKRIHVF